MIEDLYGVTKQADVVRGKGQYRRLLVKNTAKTRVSDQFSISPGMPADSARSAEALEKCSCRR